MNEPHGTAREPHEPHSPCGAQDNRTDCTVSYVVGAGYVRPVGRSILRAVRRLRPVRAVPTADPSPAPHPPKHLPHQAPANFALPEKRPKGDR